MTALPLHDMPESARERAEIIAGYLEKAKWLKTGEWKACSPLGDDSDPSFTMRPTDDGKILVHDHRPGVTFDQVVNALVALDARFSASWFFAKEDKRPARTRSNGNHNHQDKPEPTIYYDYHDADGVLRYQEVRKPGKKFYQRQPDGNGGWINSISEPAVTPLLYRLPQVNERIRQGDTVWIVEGGKSADFLREKTKFCVTTNSGGAGKFAEALASYLEGANVAILPDYDDPGFKHADDVARKLYGVAASVKIVEMPGLVKVESHGPDVIDWCELDTANNTAALQRFYIETPDWRPELHTKFKWLTPAEAQELPPVEYLIDKTIPRNGLTMLYAQSGAGKTFQAIEWAADVAEHEPVMYFVTEGEGGFPKRLAALETHRNRPLSPNFLQTHQALNLLDDDQVKDLVLDAVVIKPALIVLDTLINCAPGADENSSKDMSTVIAACKAIQRQTGAAILLVHHTTKTGQWERGSSALRAAMDVMIEMSEDNELFTVQCKKSKDDRPFDKYHRRLLPVGDSCVLVEPSSIDFAHNDELTTGEADALEILGMPVFAEAGIRAATLAEQMNVARGSAYRYLNGLKLRGLIDQSDKGEPFFINDKGKARLRHKVVS